MSELNEKIKEIIWEEVHIDHEPGGGGWLDSDTVEKAADAIELLVLQEKIDLLDVVFGDGLGNLDTNCSKDDLIEQYEVEKQELTERINQLKK